MFFSLTSNSLCSQEGWPWISEPSVSTPRMLQMWATIWSLGRAGDWLRGFSVLGKRSASWATATTPIELLKSHCLFSFWYASAMKLKHSDLWIGLICWKRGGVKIHPRSDSSAPCRGRGRGSWDLPLSRIYTIKVWWWKGYTFYSGVATGQVFMSL